jgi:hypothetical protein
MGFAARIRAAVQYESRVDAEVWLLAKPTFAGAACATPAGAMTTMAAARTTRDRRELRMAADCHIHRYMPMLRRSVCPVGQQA